MIDIFYRFARNFRPDLESLSGQRRLSGVADIISLFYSLPLLVLSLIWLLSVSNWITVRQHWSLFLLFGVVLILFNRFRFYFITEIRSGGYANSHGALDGIALWTAVLIFGAVAIWLDVFWNLGNFIFNLRTTRSAGSYWNRVGEVVTTTASSVLSMLFGLKVYLGIGGQIPISGLVLSQIVPALAGMLVQFLVTLVVYGGYIGYVIWALKQVMQTPPGRAVKFFILSLALPALAQPFGILAAGMYIQDGIAVLVFDMFGLLLVALLAQRFSQAAEASRQQSRQLEELEKLGRAILNARPDAATLPEILKDHVPLMFTTRGIHIWTVQRGTLLHEPADWKLDIKPVWNWLQRYHETKAFLPGVPFPWTEKNAIHEPLLVSPILNVVSGEAEGCVYLELQTMAIPWDDRSVASLLPAVQSLSAQVASACHQAHVYTETLAAQKTMQELTLARRIQASFLPETIPKVPGWQITAALEPARQMAGDYYDFIELPENRLGILIADVADKGLGSALYMALSSTLIRTFAEQYCDDPATVLAVVNQRILHDARANLFVTVFYGVLDPATGLLIYANAGHTPPYFVTADRGITTLRNTGMPLGIDEESDWKQETIHIHSGDVLMLYTDGVTDAQNSQGEFIDRKELLDITNCCVGQPVDQIQQAILDKLHRFVGDAPRFDDITLVILSRD
jgi:serine phosphatase RsbU (regulator of sigma subunit)